MLSPTPTTPYRLGTRARSFGVLKPERSHHDPRPCPIPPDWSGGYTFIYALQQEETWDEEPLVTVRGQHAEMSGDDNPPYDPTDQFSE